jgi:membrane fusion protein, multidrug efflux system
LFRAQGMQVALLDGQNRVHLQDVVLGRNLDTEVEIVSGLKPTDKVVGNPSLGLLEGQQVKVVQPVQGYAAEPGSQPGKPPQQAQPPATSKPGATAVAPVPSRAQAAP